MAQSLTWGHAAEDIRATTVYRRAVYRSGPYFLAYLSLPCSTPFPARAENIVPGYANIAPAQSQGEHRVAYERALIARNDGKQQQVEGIADSIVNQLETEGGAMKQRDHWGLRALAYRIKKNRKGHHMLLDLDAKATFISEMERQLSLSEDILRLMTLRVQEIEGGRSATLSRKPDDRERNFRGPKPAGRFDSGRRRSFDGREELRAPEESRHDVGVDGEE